MLDRIAAQLVNPDLRCPVSAWPVGLQHLESPGLYAWWVDADGAAFISVQLGETVAPGIVYVGQAGAAPGTASLGSRIGDNHIGGKIRNSTVRLSAAAILLDTLGEHIEGDRKISAMGERIVTQWLVSHFHLTVAPCPDRERLAAMEHLVLNKLDPPLNLRGMPLTPLRATLGKRRSALRQVEEAHQCFDRPVIHTAHRDEVPSSRTRPTLHAEIEAILKEHENRWLSTSEIARLVNARGYYMKRDATPVTDFQIHGRTRNYSHLFERDGLKVRLLS